MRHFVYLKIADGQFEKSLRQIMMQAMQDAKDLLDGFLDFQVMHSRQEENNTAFVLVELTFLNHQEMDSYLKHPLHVNMLQKLKPYLVDKAVFDD